MPRISGAQVRQVPKSRRVSGWPRGPHDLPGRWDRSHPVVALHMSVLPKGSAREPCVERALPEGVDRRAVGDPVRIGPCRGPIAARGHRIDVVTQELAGNPEATAPTGVAGRAVVERCPAGGCAVGRQGGAPEYAVHGARVGGGLLRHFEFRASFRSRRSEPTRSDRAAPTSSTRAVALLDRPALIELELVGNWAAVLQPNRTGRGLHLAARPVTRGSRDRTGPPQGKSSSRLRARAAAAGAARVQVHTVASPRATDPDATPATERLPRGTAGAPRADRGADPLPSAATRTLST